MNARHAGPLCLRRLIVSALLVPAFGGCSGERRGTAERPADTAAITRADERPDSLPSTSPTPPPLPPRDAPDSLLALAAAPDSLLDRLATSEYGYEERGLLVHGIGDGWLLVVTADSAREWIPASAVDTLLPLAELVVERLNYLTDAWDGTLRAEPVFSAPRLANGRSWRASPPDHGETPAHVIRAEHRDGTLWLEVEVRSSTGCDGEDPEVRAAGWVPAYGGQRAPTAWFFSRGC